MRWLAAVVLVACAAARSDARPPHKQALAQFFGPHLPKKLYDCRACHVPDAKDPEGEKPHNAFGARLVKVKAELRNAGKPTTIEARLDAILAEDADGDGQSNLAELLSGRYPGEKEDVPTAAEIADLKTTLAAFEKLRKAYPWRPYDAVVRPAPPKVKNTAWVRNPIDAFIAAEHESLGISPRPQAPKAVLLRRVFIDLTGLPPTPAEQKAFLDDASVDAYEKVVDRLLASARYGERWGRHWMDIWRYSDWAGYGPQVRDSQPHIWRWRDWIIDSLNEDKGYDRMILEMLAGDELAPEDPRALAGTGYLVRNFKLLSREKWMQDVVEHTSMAFLGATLGCAKCHDHMFDPITQGEYYQFRAIFEPHHVRTDRLPGEPDVKKDGLPRAYDKDLTAVTHFFIRGDDRTPDKDITILPGVPEALGGRYTEPDTIKLPRSAYLPDLRPAIVKETRQTYSEAITKARTGVEQAQQRLVRAAALVGVDWSLDRLGLTAALASLERDWVGARSELTFAEARLDAFEKTLAAEEAEAAGKKDDDLARAAFTAQQREALADLERKMLANTLAETDPAKKAAALKARKGLADAAAKVQATLKAPPSTGYTRFASPYPRESTGRRLALARWIADVENPRTARVAVNHIWLRHFGQAIVPSVFDFGRNGRLPTNAALLDWLAAEFMAPSATRAGESSSPADGAGKKPGPWSMKHLHRLIVTSATYRQASTPDASSEKVDRDNKYLWRYPPRRVEAEVVRDSIFHVAGKLDLAMSGPDIDYPLGLTVPRRSLYFRHAAEKQMEFLLLFDAAAVSECYERRHSIVPQQALALFNSELSLKHSRILARALATKAGKDASSFVRMAFEHVLARSPSAEEMTECVNFVEQQTRRLAGTKEGPMGTTPDGALPSADPAVRARENLVHVLMNHHEFVTIR